MVENQLGDLCPVVENQLGDLCPKQTECSTRMIIGFAHNTSLCFCLISRYRVDQKGLSMLGRLTSDTGSTRGGGCDTLLHVQACLCSPLGHSVVSDEEASRVSIQRRAGVKNNVHNILREYQKCDDKKFTN